MGFAPSVNAWLTRTNKQRQAIAAMLSSGRVRLASRFYIGTSPMNGQGGRNETIDLPGLFKNLGFDFNAPAPIARVIIAVATAMGLSFNQAEVETMLTTNGYNPNGVMPISSIIRDILKLDVRTSKVRTQGQVVVGMQNQGKSQRRREQRNRAKGKKVETTASTVTPVIVTPTCSIKQLNLVSGLVNWLTGSNNCSIKPANTIGLRLYVVAPSVRTADSLMKAPSYCTFDVIVLGDTLVVYGWSRENAGALSYGSKPTIYDIPSATHQVPFTTMLTQLVQNGYAKLSTFGIMDANAFVADAFEYGLGTAFSTWFNAIKAANKVNKKIADGVNQVELIESKGPVNPTTLEQIANVATHVYDDAQGNLPVDNVFGTNYGARELVGAGISSTPFGGTSFNQDTN